MGIAKAHSLKKMLFQLILLVLPTAMFVCFILWRLNNFYTILQNEWLSQGLYFASGCVAALAVYRYRFRFLSTALLVFLVNFLIYRALQALSFGEFDSFYISVKFYIFWILFTTGWAVGYAFSRSRILTIAWSAILLVAEIVLISKTSEVTVSALLGGLIPVLAYTFYILYTAELLRHLNEEESSFIQVIGKRIAAFALFLLLLFAGVLSLFKGDFKAIEKEWGGKSASNDKKDGSGNGDSESMTQQGKNGGMENKDESRLAGSLSKDKQLLFVARLDNFFGNSNIPNPLYFTNRYYTRFDTATQTFETDPDMPYNDLFSPEPSSIPLYTRKIDNKVIKQSLGTLDRKVVTAEVYNVGLSPETFVAPSTAFYCQPVSVPPEFQKQYHSAYQAKMWVSELNSAYFIYNPVGNVELARFQELRFAKLREIGSIKGPDKAFMDYYTYMPPNADYQRIGELARRITKDQEAPIDKIIAIRDYFLSKDEFNQPLFMYSDNPGIPGMPSASKLNYFLFENRKGYCAYFAGATLFMLRSLGIPSRVAAGFSTTDRSSKNPGWYWFYQDQAHAWVQVYFQDYGWIDFDTTIPDVNTQQASQPDGTPPTDIPATYLVAEGDIVSVDTLKKQLSISTAKIVYHDSEFVAPAVLVIPADASIARISQDSTELSFKALGKGMRITMISHAEALKELYTRPGDSLGTIVARLPKPVPVDEIKVHKKEEKKDQPSQKDKKDKEPVDWLRVLYISLGAIAGLGLLLLLSPFFIWLWLNAKAKKHYGSASEQAFHAYRAALFYLNQSGYAHGGRGTGEYAAHIDRSFGSRFADFHRIYQKLKYSKVAPGAEDTASANGFYLPFIKTVKAKISFGQKLRNFMNLQRTLHYFSKPKIS